MSDDKPPQSQPDNQQGCIDDRSFFERLWCKIDPFGSAYPVWIAILLITMIILFGILLRLDFDINQIGW